jgi:hypothetical protein
MRTCIQLQDPRKQLTVTVDGPQRQLQHGDNRKSHFSWELTKEFQLCVLNCEMGSEVCQVRATVRKSMALVVAFNWKKKNIYIYMLLMIHGRRWQNVCLLRHNAVLPGKQLLLFQRQQAPPKCQLLFNYRNSTTSYKKCIIGNTNVTTSNLEKSSICELPRNHKY